MAPDRSRDARPTPGSSDAWTDELARELADELEGWALEREGEVDKLDVPAARVAKSLVKSLRVVARALAASSTNPEDPGRREILARLVELRRDARRVMADGADAEPLLGRSDRPARTRSGTAPPVTLSPSAETDGEKPKAG